MSGVVFVGPTLAGEPDDVFAGLDKRPPAERGDVYRAASVGCKVIGIVDGYFEQRPAVTHKEILWAMGEGVHVVGGASIGALRAAELDAFGMRGVGTVYAQYHDGSLEDDDEVAVLHGPAELDYRATSDALVNIRATLAAAQANGVITATSRQQLQVAAKRMDYRRRGFDALLSSANGHLDSNQLRSLRSWLTDGFVDQKRQDARDLIDVMRQLLAADRRKHVNYAFEATEAWRRLTLEVDAATAGGSAQAASVLQELRLDAPRYQAINRVALLRLLARREQARRAEPVAPARLREAELGLRYRLGLGSRDELALWLSRNQLDRAAFDRLLATDAALADLQRQAASALDRELIDELRSRGEYQALAERALDKRRWLDSEDRSTGDPAATMARAGGVQQLLWWYFGRNPGVEPPADIAEYAECHGYSSADAFYRALLLEYLYCSDAGAKGRS